MKIRLMVAEFEPPLKTSRLTLCTEIVAVLFWNLYKTLKYTVWEECRFV